jgi:uncharacterized membrane protein
MKYVDLFLLFIIYSFLGWCMEMIVTNIHKEKIVNRGFLVGPICPIYGYGCILIIILLTRYIEKPIILFIMAILICSFLEYFTSYFMEKLFHARWWDYSKKKFNLNGRICADTMIPFGILGLIVMYFINPFITSIIVLIPKNIRITLAIIILIIYIIDNIVSFIIMFGIKNTITKVALDNTEEITKKVREIIKSKSYFSRRTINAFPNLKAKIEKIKKDKK